MTQWRAVRSRDSDDRINIGLEQLRITYATVPLSLAAVLINSTILCAVLWPVVAPSLSLAWLAGTYLVSLYRWLVYRRFNRARRETQGDPLWHRLHAAGVVASGVTWGAASLLLFPADSMVHQVFLAFVIAGMSAGAVTTLSAVLPLTAVFLVLNLLPLVGRFLAAPDYISQSMALMTALFTLMLLVSARRLNSTIVESLQIRDARQQAEATVRYQAQYDDLTELPNRRLLLERLQQEMARSRRHDHMGAVLFLDLDHFKTINDSLGHRVGDQLLQAVARRLKGRLREEDMVARLGGDEFVVLAPEIADSLGDTVAGAERMALQLLDLFRSPFMVDGHELHLSASIGYALFPIERQDPEALLQQADVAMYSAKEGGRDGMRMFQPSMQAAVDRRLRTERGLRRALGNDELVLVYQPQVDDDGNIIGAEALVRWQHAQMGMIPPAQFIPIAEETGLIYPLGEWILRRACDDLASLGEHHELNVSVNISPKQFREPGFVERVKRILEETGAPPQRLTLEITESVVIDNVEQTVERMRLLKTMGISFSVDDFGTGHSSLAYLKRLPLDVIKIDQSFVRDVVSDPNDAVIVETIIVMSRHLGLEVIAEGVETEQVLEFLRSRGCHQFQGYLFGRPMPFATLCGRFLMEPLADARA